MAGSAGSKYGIVRDEIPLKNQESRETGAKNQDDCAELQDLRLLIPRLLQSKQTVSTEPK